MSAPNKWFYTPILIKKGVLGRRSSSSGSGILFCSGMIAGEGIIGIVLAVLAVVGIADKLDLSGYINVGMVGVLVLLGILFIAVCISGTKRKEASAGTKK